MVANTHYASPAYQHDAAFVAVVDDGDDGDDGARALDSSQQHPSTRPFSPTTSKDVMLQHHGACFPEAHGTAVAAISSLLVP